MLHASWASWLRRLAVAAGSNSEMSGKSSYRIHCHRVSHCSKSCTDSRTAQANGCSQRQASQSSFQRQPGLPPSQLDPVYETLKRRRKAECTFLICRPAVSRRTISPRSSQPNMLYEPPEAFTPPPLQNPAYPIRSE